MSLAPIDYHIYTTFILICSSFNFFDIKLNKTSGQIWIKKLKPPIIVGVPTRGPGFQLVNAACFLVPDDDARGNTVTHGLSWFRPQGRTSSKRGCARALYYLAPGVLVVGGTSEAREGGKLPSLC